VGRNDWEALLESDQIWNEHKVGHAFKGWHEGNISILHSLTNVPRI